MKYKVGDRVRIKSIDWYNANKSKRHGTVVCGDKYFEYDMREWCGKIMTILKVYQTYYTMEEDGAKDLWTDEMIEGLAEEIEIAQDAKTFSEGYEQGYEDGQHDMNEWVLPEGYVFKDENGNVINATKIVLEKKKKEYPKTYEECCKVLHYAYEQRITMIGVTRREEELFKSLIVLKRCRDAYWKIAGEEMGLGISWKPDWLDDDTKKYVITSTKVFETFGGLGYINYVLAFPTKEMRDAFKENFDPDIEFCKELL